ncbi:MAG: helix-turn-helix transcriptional regulator [Defluviitaleaceae bacterium]|nr:helix-turn-helix transcriptional regulator [Defluviitaleaceae bacterium]
MAIYFNEKLKRYRKANDLTQERLAEIFRVSPQAVSRWETGASYPDIELLPRIASYFKVTVDELLGVDKMRDCERINEITAEVNKKWEAGLIDDAQKILREAVREYPHEHGLLLSLALTVSVKKEPDGEKKKAGIQEAIVISEHVLDSSTDDEIRNRALFSLSQNYKEAGEYEKAVATAKKLASAAGSGDIVLTTVLQGTELFEQHKRNISLFAGFLADGLYKLAIAEHGMGSTERVELIKKAAEILETVFEDGDSRNANFHLSWFYRELAENYCAAGKNDSALDCLAKAAKNAAGFDSKSDCEKYTSLAVRGIDERHRFVRSSPSNQCGDLLDSILSNCRFELIKDDPRFIAALNELEKQPRVKQ